MQKQNIYFPSVITFAIFGFAVLGLFGASFVMLGTSISFLFSNKPEALSVLIMGVGFGSEALILGVAGFYSLQRVMNVAIADTPARLAGARWHTFLMLLIAALFIGIGALMVEVQWLNVLLIPIFTVIGISLPIWAFMNAGLFEIELGERWRAWAIFGLGMTVGPAIMLVLELVIGAFFFLIVVLYIATQPNLLFELQNLIAQIENITDPNLILELVEPYLLNPALLGLIYFYVALCVPVIEEIFKPIGVWLFARRINSPAQGFALGLLSGAAYALFESLGVSNQTGAEWAVVVSTRAGTGLLHIVTTGITGWAIASAWLERRYLRLFLAYALSISMHGIWNASAITIGLFSALTFKEIEAWQPFIVGASTVTMILLIGLMVGVLLIGNKRARDASRPTV